MQCCCGEETVAKKGQKKDQKKDPTEVQEQKAPQDAQLSAEVKETKPEAASTSKFDVAAFLQGTREELEKVVWPSRQQLISESIAVLLMVTLSATLVYLVDNLFVWVSSKVF